MKRLLLVLFAPVALHAQKPAEGQCPCFKNDPNWLRVGNGCYNRDTGATTTCSKAHRLKGVSIPGTTSIPLAWQTPPKLPKSCIIKPPKSPRRPTRNPPNNAF